MTAKRSSSSGPAGGRHVRRPVEQPPRPARGREAVAWALEGHHPGAEPPILLIERCGIEPRPWHAGCRYTIGAPPGCPYSAYPRTRPSSSSRVPSRARSPKAVIGAESYRRAVLALSRVRKWGAAAFRPKRKCAPRQMRAGLHQRRYELRPTLTWVDSLGGFRDDVVRAGSIARN